jgi:uncharacterized membrane protein
MTNYFSQFDSDRIVAAIAEAEKKSSGEVRVHVTRRIPENLEERALRRFELLGMTKTAGRNGVLIYIAPRAHKFRILGDVAIHEKCGPEFWQEVAHGMEESFRRGEFTEGVVRCVERVGEVLARYFPRLSKDRDELSNAIDEEPETDHPK